MSTNIVPKKEKILIIESDTNFGPALDNALKNNGYSTQLIRGSKDAITTIKSFEPHLVILDIILSDGNGYDVLAQKYSDSTITKIPLFFITTQGLPIDMKKVPQDSVAEFFMALHADPLELVNKINAYFNYKTDADANSQGSTNLIKLLWVEDDKLIGNILSKKLSSSGFDLFHAKNGEEALDYIDKNTPDVVVVDLLLPGMSGFDILQKMQMSDRTKKIPSMVLSNLSRQSDVDKARLLGAKKFLVKAANSLDQIVEEIKSIAK